MNNLIAKTINDYDNELSCLDYACSSNTSETGIASSLGTNAANDTDNESNHELNENNKQRFQHLMREKEHALLQALKDVRQLSSELERLHQSEAWYREQLHQQQNNQLQALQRHYAQQRCQVQHNQRLQCECLSLYARCNNLERELQTQSQRAMQQLALLKSDAAANSTTAIATDVSSDNQGQFELLCQSSFMAEQQQLIEVLRRQKQTLLLELQDMAQEKDAQFLTLQTNLAHKELQEQKCQEQLQLQAQERLQLLDNMENLQQKIELQRMLLNSKEQHIAQLQQRFRADAVTAQTVHEIHDLSIDYHQQISLEHMELKEIRKKLLQLVETVNERKSEEEPKELNFDIPAETNNESIQNILIKLYTRYAHLCAAQEKKRYDLHLLKRATDDTEQSVKIQKKYDEYVKEMQELVELITEMEGKNDLNLKDIEHKVTNAEEETDEENKKQQKILLCVPNIETVNDNQSRICLLQQLLKQQHLKLQVLQKAQAEWQQLQTQLGTAETLAHEQHNQLTESRAELEHLHNLFLEQNHQLLATQLQVAAREAKQQSITEEVKLLRQQLNLSKNNADSVLELKQQLKQLQDERDAQLQHIQYLQNELKRHKRRALLIPEFNNIAHATTKHLDAQIADRLRILSKVLEAEHARKIQRYDLHIRSLLKNIKCLKKMLRVAEAHAAINPAVTAQIEMQLKELQAQLHQLHMQHSESQQTIKKLQEKVKQQDEQYNAANINTMSSKTISVASTQESCNLIDDFKKLIKQSATSTQRPSTQAVLELIERSQQCVPKLHKLEFAVEQLCSDVKNIMGTGCTLYDEMLVANQI